LVVGIVLFVAAVALVLWRFTPGRPATTAEGGAAFEQAMASGKTFYDKNDAAKAVGAFQTALAMNPANPDVHLNLANAFLLAGQPLESVKHAREVLHFEPGNAAGAYVLGCAWLRQNQHSNAVQALQQAKDADPTVNPVSFQLGRAYFGWGKFEDAALQFREFIQFETNAASPRFASAHFLLAQSLTRLGQRDEAAALLAEHQKLTGGQVGNADNAALFEQCQYTEIRAPFPLEQPAPDGIAVKFVDDTARAFGGNGGALRGPFAVLDINRRSLNDLLVLTDGGVQLLWNSNGVFAAQGEPLPLAVKEVRAMLVGDLQNDRYEDVVLLSPEGTAVLRFATNGVFNDATRIAGLGELRAVAGVLADLDFTGKLGLVAVNADGSLTAYTNLGTGVFRQRRPEGTRDVLAATGVSAALVDDWNNDDLPDLLLTRPGQPPRVVSNLRGAGLSDASQPADWAAALAVTTGDFNNDLRVDVALLAAGSVDLHFAGLKEPLRLPARGHRLQQLQALDYDNDGWLDLVAWGDAGVRAWRNRGNAGFHETTAELGLTVLAQSKILNLTTADFDQDCDLDLVLDVAGAGLKFFRNDGGNANGMLKLRLLGNRSNASGLGVKAELTGAGWHSIRTVKSLPVEIGVGPRRQLDSVTTRWFDTKLDMVEVPVDCREPLIVFELVMPTGSCPYLYAWDGKRHRFVTDLLSASPVGLPVAPGRFIEADPEEYVWVGDETNFQPLNGSHVLQITEELREILYLDVAQLVVVDHPPGTEVHPTSKLMPGRPFAPHELWQLGGRLPLAAAASEGAGHSTEDATAALAEMDGQKASPFALRGPQYRGLAEPFSVTLDFGPLDESRPLTLALTGWLRFGGGMANIAGAHNPDFPFPFPVLEAETAAGWSKVDVIVGAPAGKTKTILADLAGRLPAGTRRLRLTQAFEIHWDRIALFSERTVLDAASITRLAPTATDLHWRGYSEVADLPWTDPLTPLHEQAKPVPPWHITPSGWVTRYGPVDELIAQADQGLALIAGGDELTLKFAADTLPPKPDGKVREFFLHTVGWDKDADYHVARGTEVGPLPWVGMDDQAYGRQERPAFPSDALHERYNTRWVGERTFVRGSR